VTQIIEIPKKTNRSSASSTSSLVLANGDILFQHDLICKLSDDPSTHSSSLDHPGYHTLDEFRLVSGKVSNIKVCPTTPHSLSDRQFLDNSSRNGTGDERTVEHIRRRRACYQSEITETEVDDFQAQSSIKEEREVACRDERERRRRETLPIC
jgi:hypothetical protein